MRQVRWQCEGVANAKAGVVDLGMSESVAEGVSESTSVLCLPESKSISQTSCCFFFLPQKGTLLKIKLYYDLILLLGGDSN